MRALEFLSRNCRVSAAALPNVWVKWMFDACGVWLRWITYTQQKGTNPLEVMCNKGSYFRLPQNLVLALIHQGSVTSQKPCSPRGINQHESRWHRRWNMGSYRIVMQEFIMEWRILEWGRGNRHIFYDVNTGRTWEEHTGNNLGQDDGGTWVSCMFCMHCFKEYNMGQEWTF